MTFAARNEAWTGTRRVFHQLQSQKVRVWTIEVVGSTVFTEWGQLGGAIQKASDTLTGVNQGKKNEKSPEQYALERARDLARKKNWEGYSEVRQFGPAEVLTGRTNVKTGFTYWADEIETAIDFDNLPLNLSFYKPDNTLGAGMLKKAQNRQVWYTRKRNGLAFVLARGKDHPRLYSRRMLRQHDDEVGGALTWNDRFPYLIETAKSFMPENSIILGELIVNRKNSDPWSTGSDDFKAIQSYTKSLTLQSLRDQEANGFASFYIWDIAFWNGKDLVREVPVRERLSLIHELPFPVVQVAGSTYSPFLPIEVYSSEFCPSVGHAVALAQARDWEGFVVVDPDGTYGEKAYNFKGKPDRPGTACAKLKPTFEDDFVAYWDPEKGWGERSTKNRNNQGIKSVALFQYNKEGQLVEISNVSSGLTDEQKTNWADPKRWPQVWKVEYKDRRYTSDGEDSNALDFAAFVEERTDKKPEECINPKL